jgi:hypothetical protein
MSSYGAEETRIRLSVSFPTIFALSNIALYSLRSFLRCKSYDERVFIKQQDKLDLANSLVGQKQSRAQKKELYTRLTDKNYKYGDKEPKDAVTNQQIQWNEGVDKK